MAQLLPIISRDVGKKVFESWNHDLEIKEAKEGKTKDKNIQTLDELVGYDTNDITL